MRRSAPSHVLEPARRHALSHLQMLARRSKMYYGATPISRSVPESNSNTGYGKVGSGDISFLLKGYIEKELVQQAPIALKDYPESPRDIIRGYRANPEKMDEIDKVLSDPISTPTP